MRKLNFEYTYDSKRISYSVWLTGENTTIETIVYLGTVQVGKLHEWVADECPPYTAVIQGAPHWLAQDDGSDIPEFMYSFTKNVFDKLVADYDIKLLHIVADSQAVPGVIALFALDEYKKYMRDLVLLQPLGLTQNIYAGTSKERIKLFRKRIIKNGYYQLTSLILDNRLRHNHRTLIKMVDLRSSEAAAQYSSGLNHDSLHDLQKLLLVNPKVSIVCGSKDRIFSPEEIEENLLKENITVEIVRVPGVPHSPIATRLGMKLLNEAFRILNIQIASRP